MKRRNVYAASLADRRYGQRVVHVKREKLLGKIIDKEFLDAEVWRESEEQDYQESSL